MKILFQNRNRNLWQGGDYTQLDNTVVALRKLGYEIDISEEYVVKPNVIEQYDLVHLWNFSMEWTKFQLWVARKHKKPVICSMIYHESGEWISYNLQQIMADELSYAIFQTKGESDRLKRHIKINENKIAYIQNGIDPFWLDTCSSRIPMERFVLTVGRIEPNKGQLTTAKVCRDLGVAYICIGEIMDVKYATECMKNGAEIHKPMTKEELKPWYYSASVYIQPSKAETWSLCVDEAGSQGTPIILTEACERDDYPFVRCKWEDFDSIRNEIKGSLDVKKDFTFKETLKTWDTVAEQIAKLYENINHNANIQ